MISPKGKIDITAVRDEDDGTITAQSAFRSIRSSGETDADDGGAIKTILPRGSAAKEPLALSSL